MQSCIVCHMLHMLHLDTTNQPALGSLLGATESTNQLFSAQWHLHANPTQL
jgi:hypothetical protein